MHCYFLFRTKCVILHGLSFSAVSKSERCSPDDRMDFPGSEGCVSRGQGNDIYSGLLHSNSAILNIDIYR